MDAGEDRARMVESQLAARGIRDEAVLRAMRTVPREVFVPAELRHVAYEDNPLPIGADQTISQPYIVALMAEALQLKGHERVLEIGAGSGYAAAVLGSIAREVFTIERHAGLAEAAAARLHLLGMHNVTVRHGDGTLGWAERAPFDAIAVTASGPRLPDTLLAQLGVGGRLVMPLEDDRGQQTLVRVTQLHDNTLQLDDLGDVRFVPLIGAEGWSDELT